MIVRRESDGFGFTLSQQMPVFVDKVFPGSSAERARVSVGDRILKVKKFRTATCTCIAKSKILCGQLNC